VERQGVGEALTNFQGKEISNL